MSMLPFVFSLLWAFPAQAYVQTIIKNYTSCNACHVDSKGGGLLHDYGRAMSESFMSTWALEDEAKEFIIGNSKQVDIGADFRFLTYNTKDGTEAFAKVFEAETAYTNGTFTLGFSVGKYGRNGTDITFRKSSLALRATDQIELKIGHFTPAYGLGINQHIRFIKSRLGLGQGTEQFGAELYFRPKWMKLYLTASNPTIKAFGGIDGGYQVRRGEGKPSISAKASLTTFKKLEIGFSTKFEREKNQFGLFGKISPFKNFYNLSEIDFLSKTVLGYTRFGYFPTKGLDLYFGSEFFKPDSDETDIRFFGGTDWMIRPRFEIQAVMEYTFDKSDRAGFYRLISMIHLWL